MANFVFNVAKGRVAELCNRVDNSDPAASRLYVVLLAATNLEAQSVLEDADTLAAVVAGTTREATNTNYARIVLTAALIGPFAPDDSGNVFACDIADQTWTAVANDGTGAIGALLICYAAVATPANSAILPMTHHQFQTTPDGSDITAQIAAGGFYSAS